jgi:hypothetical protein
MVPGGHFPRKCSGWYSSNHGLFMLHPKKKEAAKKEKGLVLQLDISR